MRTILGRVLLGIGGFLVVAAVLAVTWAPGVVKNTPIDVDTTTHLDGTAAKIDVETGELSAPRPIKILSETESDTDASTDSTGVWVQKTCVVFNDDGNTPECVDGDDPRLVTADIDVFATDRVTGLAVNDGDLLPADAIPHEGLVNKFPFDAQKKTYPYWDGTLGRAVDAVYESTEKVAGITTYKYVATVTDEPIEVAKDTPGTYTSRVELYVEPKTGAIQQQTENQQRYLEDGTQVLDLQAQFTDDQVQVFKDDADTNMGKLTLMLFIVPLAGFIGGGLALLGGAALLFTARRASSSETSTKTKQAVSA